MAQEPAAEAAPAAEDAESDAPSDADEEQVVDKEIADLQVHCRLRKFYSICIFEIK